MNAELPQDIVCGWTANLLPYLCSSENCHCEPVTEVTGQQILDALEHGDHINAAAGFLKGHILLFANMDDRGMYSGNIDLTKKIETEGYWES